ncbi:peptide cleavage/export ABC transporter [Lactobacillus sp.]|uniref:peptide cleavage/export ABC transporter n=1 Tax=Lactobacillus sp. TaxID=1591 RepID=UPI003EF4B448
MTNIFNSIKYHKSYVSQLDETDCGIACLAMVLKYYHSNVTLAHLRQLAKTNTEGTTALGLVKAAEQLYLNVTAVKTDLSLFLSKEITYPLIVHVVKDNELLHYYTILQDLGSKLVIADPDPDVGIIEITKTEFSQQWTGVALLFKAQANFKEVHEKNTTVWSLLPLLYKKESNLIIKLILVSFLVTGIDIISSFFLQGLIDSYIPKGRSNLITVFSCGLLIAYMASSLFSFEQSLLLIHLEQKLSSKLNFQYLKHLFNLPISFFTTRKTGEITSRFSDTGHIVEALSNLTVSLFLDLTIIITVGFILFFQNSHLFILTILSAPLFMITIASFSKRFDRLNNEQMESNSKVSSTIIESIEGIETIKAFNGEQKYLKMLRHKYLHYLQKNFEYGKMFAWQNAIKTLIETSLTLLVLWFGSKDVISHSMTIGQLMTFNSLLVYFFEPVKNLINLQPIIQSAQVAQKRLNEVYAVKRENWISKPITSRSQIDGTIQFKSVYYHYDFDENILNNINLQIKKGEKLTIVGMSGSGKSTLAKLLVGFNYPSQGSLTLNHLSIKEINSHLLRDYISYTPQIPNIFSGTIRDNLLLSSDNIISDQQLVDACKAAEIYQDIDDLPLRFDTQLDEQGKMLSGGQKQRLAIARALLSPATVLIFDETTSGLDTITESKIVRNLLQIPNKTIIFVAHHLSIAQLSDRVIVLHQGKIVEHGKPQELLDHHSYYYNLINNV